MRVHGVVVRPPCLDDPLRGSQRREQVLVQALVAQTTIETFDEAVLPRLVRRDVMPLDSGVLAPGKDGVTGQFGAIVANHYPRQPATFRGGAQLTNKCSCIRPAAELRTKDRFQRKRTFKRQSRNDLNWSIPALPSARAA